MHAFAATLALILERLIGYPKPLLETIRHPVIWMGKLIDLFDRRLNRTDPAAAVAQGRRSVFSLALLLLVTLIPTAIIGALLRQLPGGWIIEAVLATALLAQKELGLAVRSVADALDTSLEAGRKAVRGVVGRDPETLDEAGVSRAAIESLAENTADGVIAPLFWLLVLGLPGIALYKAINTADSMIGHKTAKIPRFRLGQRAARRCRSTGSRRGSTGLLVRRRRVPGVGRQPEGGMGRDVLRCRKTRFAQCRLAGSRHGRRARFRPWRPAQPTTAKFIRCQNSAAAVTISARPIFARRSISTPRCSTSRWGCVSRSRSSC